MSEQRGVYRVDANQAEIVHALRKIGATVQYLYMVGGGCPDLLVGYNKRNVLLEIKSDKRAKLTKAERKWHDEWGGEVDTATTPEEAIEIVRSNLMEMQC